MTTTITNIDGFATSLQISKLKDITSGSTVTFERPVLIKNISSYDITNVTLVLIDDTEVSTTLYTGWNVELVKGIKNAPSGLQYGY